MRPTKPWVLRHWWSSALAGVVLILASIDVACEDELLGIFQLAVVALFALGGLCFFAHALGELRASIADG